LPVDIERRDREQKQQCKRRIERVEQQAEIIVREPSADEQAFYAKQAE
jgi:hypothetical protein